MFSPCGQILAVADAWPESQTLSVLLVAVATGACTARWDGAVLPGGNTLVCDIKLTWPTPATLHVSFTAGTASTHVVLTVR